MFQIHTPWHSWWWMKVASSVTVLSCRFLSSYGRLNILKSAICRSFWVLCNGSCVVKVTRSYYYCRSCLILISECIVSCLHCTEYSLIYLLCGQTDLWQVLEVWTFHSRSCPAEIQWSPLQLVLFHSWHDLLAAPTIDVDHERFRERQRPAIFWTRWSVTKYPEIVFRVLINPFSIQKRFTFYGIRTAWKF